MFLFFNFLFYYISKFLFVPSRSRLMLLLWQLLFFILLCCFIIKEFFMSRLFAVVVVLSMKTVPNSLLLSAETGTWLFPQKKNYVLFLPALVFCFDFFAFFLALVFSSLCPRWD